MGQLFDLPLELKAFLFLPQVCERNCQIILDFIKVGESLFKVYKDLHTFLQVSNERKTGQIPTGVLMDIELGAVFYLHAHFVKLFDDGLDNPLGLGLMIENTVAGIALGQNRP